MYVFFLSKCVTNKKDNVWAQSSYIILMAVSDIRGNGSNLIGVQNWRPARGSRLDMSDQWMLGGEAVKLDKYNILFIRHQQLYRCGFVVILS